MGYLTRAEKLTLFRRRRPGCKKESATGGSKKPRDLGTGGHEILKRGINILRRSLEYACKIAEENQTSDFGPLEKAEKRWSWVC
jgi:hypothetical protein